MRTDRPDREELDMAIHKLKRDKAEGTDETSINLYKELTSENRKEIVKLLGEWWNEEHIPDEDLMARVVLIFKKGDPTKLENYRPISLLNVLYKILAIVLQVRISEKVDPYIHNMQYGFWKKRSTADATAIIRRIAQIAESTTEKFEENQIQMVFFDWGKAFDKVNHQALRITMERFNLDKKIVNMVMAMYRSPKF